MKFMLIIIIVVSIYTYYVPFTNKYILSSLNEQIWNNVDVSLCDYIYSNNK